MSQTEAALIKNGSVTADDLASTLDLSGKTVTLPSGVGGKFESIAVVTDRQASGTSGGTNVINTWTTRDLNHELFDPDGIVTVASNQFTLAAGTYYIEWASPLHDTGTTKTILYNATDAATAGEGEGGYASPSSDCTFWFRGVARVTITASKAFEIRYNVTHVQSGYGLGIATSRGSYEYYTTVKIFKEA